ncbi:MAG: hypothetical protein IKD69_02525, partial [Solobacterium sp.]|nr:hypothetical protein [Solobacterium sp.]
TACHDSRESWLRRIEEWLLLWKSAIMYCRRTGSCYECALFSAAYVEVLESRGKKEELIQQYSEKYSHIPDFCNYLLQFCRSRR